MWKPGDVIVYRDVAQQWIWFAIPMTVVQDTPDWLALYWRAGTPVKVRTYDISHHLRPKEAHTPEKIPLVDSLWVNTDVLCLIQPGTGHSVDLIWKTGTALLSCWYINLQRPICRTPIGIDTMDYYLDLVISPDLKSFRWKDEDEFAEAVEIGVISSIEAQSIRAEGERVIGLLQDHRPPFCDGWQRWIPPADLNIPVFPDGWDRLYPENLG
jgi:hypothetical protein